MQTPDLRSSVARVHSLGSARAGTEVFVAQRLSALALIPLLIWFVTSILSLIGADYASVVAWIRSPWVTVFLILLMLILLYHALIGLREVIQDYVHHEVLKAITLVCMQFFVVTIALASVLAVLRVALGGA